MDLKNFDWLAEDALFKFVGEEIEDETILAIQQTFLPEFEAAIYKNLAEKNKDAQ